MDAEALRRFRERSGGILFVPMQDGSALSLRLERFDVLAPGAVLTTTDASGSRPLDVDLALFRGPVEEIPGSWAVLSFAPRTIQGFIELGERSLVLAPAEQGSRAGSLPIHVLFDHQDLADLIPQFECETERLPQPERELTAWPDERLGTDERLVSDVAVECDYEYGARFGGDLEAAAGFALMLMGSVSLIYERDINVSIRVPYLNLWAVEPDPYMGTDRYVRLNEFVNWWNANRTDVARHTAHLLSGRGAGRGLAYVDVLCRTTIAYALSEVAWFSQHYDLPMLMTNTHVYTVAHELGHNFGSDHTHSCFWQANGYAPPGALLDSCYTAEGLCYSGPTGILPPDKGTIMSYCTYAGGGGAQRTIRLAFHPACRDLMRSRSADSCMPAAVCQPPTGLSASVTGHRADLEWNASASPDVVRYDVHRSCFLLDPNAERIETTASTVFTDAALLGTYYYKVRAVRLGDESGFSDEVEASVCSWSGPASHPGSPWVRPVAADFDGDGIPDLVTGNASQDHVLVHLGRGDGSFEVPVAFAAGTMAVAVAASDFDEDGILDLAVANHLENGTVSVLTGQGGSGVGDGTFGSPVSYPAGVLPRAVWAADLDEDGILDLAVAHRGAGGSVAILIGRGADGVGDGSFAAPADYPAAGHPTGLAAGDFNADGVIDLAVVDSSTTGEVAILLGRGAGGAGDGVFEAPVRFVAGPSPNDIAAGDFDEDGITDLVVVNREAAGTVTVLRGQGAGGFGDGTFLPGGVHPAGFKPSAVAVADVNDDGIADLVVASDMTSGIWEATVATILLGKGIGTIGDGTFHQPQPPVRAVYERDSLETLRTVRIADLDGDGAPDVAGTRLKAGQELAVLRATCTGTLGSEVMVVSPNGGEEWPVRGEREIRWTRGEGVIGVDVEVSRDGGARWETIASGLTGTSFPWTVTPPTSGRALIRIRDATRVTRSDVSDAVFTVAPRILGVGEPFAGQLWLHSVQPNPAGSALVVHFSLPGTGPVTVEVLDLAGRVLLSRRIDGRAGLQSLALGLVASVRSGIHFVRLAHNGRSVAAKAAIVR